MIDSSVQTPFLEDENARWGYLRVGPTGRLQVFNEVTLQLCCDFYLKAVENSQELSSPKFHYRPERIAGY